MEFGVLGPLEVRTPEATIEIRRGLPRTILTYLAMRPGETVTSDALMDTLWGEDQPVNPANALQTQVSYLRKRLATHAATQPIVTRPGGYSLDVAREAVDAHRFEQAVRSVSRMESTDALSRREALDTIDAALALWRGAALADALGEEFALAESARLEELRLTAFELRHDLALGLGRHRDIVGDISALIADHPLREKLHEQLMLALYRSGRQADALRAFETARRLLADQIGIDPGPELRELERQILDHDPALVFVAPFEEAPPAAVPIELPDTPNQPIDAGHRARRRANLPAPVTGLVGRDVEIDRVRHLLDRSRLVTLTGPAGAGKSRLAVESARLLGDVGDVWFVDLGDIDELRHVATAVAAALDVPTVPGEDPAETVAGAFAERSGTLVLDTCEHVVGAVAALVGRILRDAADIRVLATSRRPLNVGGEIAWPVPPLAIAPLDVDPTEGVSDYPAMELFVQRAAAVRPDFELTADLTPDVAAICMSLDGLPLAIELAAARIDVLSPAQIRERLSSRFDLLVDGGRDTTARQQTLRGAIDWSIGLLDEAQRTFFARLGVFSGTFDLETASCVGAVSDGETLELVTALVRHSMVTVVGGERYRLLDTLRAYALDMLEQLDADETRARHAACFVELAELAEHGIRGSDQNLWLTKLRLDLPNHRAVLEWLVSTGDSDGAARLAGALGWFWTLDGMLADACQQLERVLEFTELPGRRRSKVLWSLALIVASTGELERAKELASEGVELGRRAADDVQTGCSLNALAVAEWALGDFDRSTESRQEALRLFDAAGDPWGAALCRVLLARTAIDTRDPAACELVGEGLAAARSTGDRHLIGMALEQQSRLALADDNLVTALAAARESLELHREIGYTEGTIAARHVLAQVLLEDGRADAALIEHTEALRAAVTIGHRAAMCEAIEGIAAVRRVVGDVAGADDLLQFTLRERNRRRLPPRSAECDQRLGAQSVDRLDTDQGAPEPGAVSDDGLIAELLSPLDPEPAELRGPMIRA